MAKTTITERVDEMAIALLAQHPEGMRWADLNRAIEASDPTLHPKTINGRVWKLVERFPEQVYKPSKGLFRLTQFKSDDE